MHMSEYDAENEYNSDDDLEEDEESYEDIAKRENAVLDQQERDWNRHIRE